jgi:hypothetical protein
MGTEFQKADEDEACFTKISTFSKARRLEERELRVVRVIKKLECCCVFLFLSEELSVKNV